MTSERMWAPLPCLLIGRNGAAECDKDEASVTVINVTASGPSTADVSTLPYALARLTAGEARHVRSPDAQPLA
ncbi:hypothetical protein GCM10018965_019950 [Nonomuraea roseola]